MLKGKGKSVIPERPKPPSMAQIHHDVENVDDNDIVFSENFENIDKSVAMEESYLDLAENESENLSEDKKTSEQDKIFQQTKQLIDFHNKLKDSPHLLQKQYDYLQQLEKEVSDSIHGLREASESFNAER